MSILVLNAGSSTLKFALFSDNAEIETCHGLVDWKGQQSLATLTMRAPQAEPKVLQARLADHGDAVGWILRELSQYGFAEPIRIIGHRVVHGGTDFRDSVLIDESVNQAMQGLARLAPLHHPPVLTTFRATRSALPDVPQVAVFDTSYFADLPERAIVYPVPYEWYEEYGVRRFGFHGISHQYCATRTAELMQRSGDHSLRLIICHLGSGCSATAVRGGQPISTTMGFTPLEGLMMGTRSGSIDPGILIYMMQEHDWDAKQYQETLNRHSGLLGVSGISSDYREVEKQAATGHVRSQLAIDMFADRIRSTIGSLAVSLGGVDGLVFTAGIGENSASLRTQVCFGLECLGLRLEEDKNQNCFADCNIASSDSSGQILVMQTREEQMVAVETKHFLNLM